MAQTKYTYSVATDTLNASAALDSLKTEIQNSSITIALDYLTVLGDVLDVYMKDSLASGEEADLDALISAHDGVPEASEPTQVAVASQSAPPPFASKKTPEGKNLYGRIRGKSFSLSSGANSLDFDIPYAACKITGLEVIGGEIGDTLDFFVLDDDSGTYSTIPNYVLNQFGFDVAVSKDFYKRDSAYDADLYYNMCISISYYSQSAKTVYINYVLHEVKT